MWSRRAQEYEAKINSGDIVAIADHSPVQRRRYCTTEWSVV